jgi:transcription-repair coupling factor (superfamily II helicase)
VGATQAGASRLHGLLSSHWKGIPLHPDPSSRVLEEAARHPVVTVGKLSGGFAIEEERIVFLTESEIFGERKHAAVAEVSREEALTSMSELNPGDAVVHLDHGVGIYLGLTRITAGGIPNDFLLIEYAEGDKLYLPVYRLNRIHRYIGSDAGKPHIDRLGNPAAWQKSTEKAKRAVEEMAQELIRLYATRKVAKGTPLSRADEGYLSFEADFPFEETRDQLRTLEEVCRDLESDKPMDRLVCGDVGFGKTEIALRAAFRTAMDGKQVAVLVPTTILAQQHFENFRRRFAPYPIRVDFLSRFKSAAEQKKVVALLKEGSIDIVVGTHRLLSKDIAFCDLGLLVIDEEHRFGVKHKERIQSFRNQVHVLTLTATPIPRTLQLSMAGIRDLSVINTPPLDRKAIETFLVKSEDGLIRDVLRKELARKGQVYFVHNRVETIHAMGAHLRKLVPEARIAVAHGQMTERELEETMHRFIARESDVLLCTTIIESGLDIPSANTIVIHRADTFGLAQLYQLRGRVGRSDQTSYAYLLVPGEEIISRDALKRLKVLKNFTELGSGLKIALHDLEIRGAGNLLGTSQAGHIAAVGFELYTQLLEREVRRLKGEEIAEETDTEIQCYLPAYLPDDYVPDTHERLLLYKRFSSTQTAEALEGLRGELTDRFGAIPPTAENLFRIVDLKIVARALGVTSLRLTADRPCIEFSDGASVDIDRLLRLVRKDKRVTLRPDNRLVLDLAGSADSLEETKKILLALA